ncbi:DUF6191 domain-containing protein [Uniformispora flossi]|uniref:DUF6191 domain-containing protein n=1 Tax=Uniformispora flossi TaxID=3390723 RepID=UPI003C2B41C1
MGLFEELFSPGAKHRDDERNRLTVARDDDQENGGPGPIDFKRGVVVIRVPAKPAAAADAADAAAAADPDGGEAGEDAGDSAGTITGGSGPPGV